jgi:hypothetical protein
LRGRLDMKFQKICGFSGFVSGIFHHGEFT